MREYTAYNGGYNENDRLYDSLYCIQRRRWRCILRPSSFLPYVCVETRAHLLNLMCHVFTHHRDQCLTKYDTAWRCPVCPCRGTSLWTRDVVLETHGIRPWRVAHPSGTNVERIRQIENKIFIVHLSQSQSEICTNVLLAVPLTTMPNAHLMLTTFYNHAPCTKLLFARVLHTADTRLK